MRLLDRILLGAANGEHRERKGDAASEGEGREGNDATSCSSDDPFSQLDAIIAMDQSGTTPLMCLCLQGTDDDLDPKSVRALALALKPGMSLYIFHPCYMFFCLLDSFRCCTSLCGSYVSNEQCEPQNGSLDSNTVSDTMAGIEWFPSPTTQKRRRLASEIKDNEEGLLRVAGERQPNKAMKLDSEKQSVCTACHRRGLLRQVVELPPHTSISAKHQQRRLFIDHIRSHGSLTIGRFAPCGIIFDDFLEGRSVCPRFTPTPVGSPFVDSLWRTSETPCPASTSATFTLPM